MSIQQIIITAIVILSIPIIYLVFLNKKKYQNNYNTICTNISGFFVVNVFNLSIFLLLKLIEWKYQFDTPHLLVNIFMYYFSLVFFLVLRLQTTKFDSQCEIRSEPGFIGSLIQYIFALLTPFFTYLIAIKFEGQALLFFLYCLANSTLTMVLAIKLSKKHI